MLGAIKGDPELENIPLFRLLARRWKPVVPVLRDRPSSLSRRKDEEPRRSRVWTQKAQPAIYTNRKIEARISKRAWNPWLWIK